MQTLPLPVTQLTISFTTWVKNHFIFVFKFFQSISGARIALNYSNNLPEHILPSPYVEDCGNPENRQIVSNSQW